MKKSNCLFYALRKFKSDGGYLVIRWTYWNKWKIIKWPHFLWLPACCPDKDIPCPYFLSLSPKGEKIIRILPPPIFEGEIHSGDEKKLE